MNHSGNCNYTDNYLQDSDKHAAVSCKWLSIRYLFPKMWGTTGIDSRRTFISNLYHDDLSNCLSFSHCQECVLMKPTLHMLNLT